MQKNDEHGSSDRAMTPGAGLVVICASCGARFAAGDNLGVRQHKKDTGHAIFRQPPIVETR